MDVLAAFLRNVEAKSLRFVCRNNLSQLLCDHHRKVVQTLLHLICIITRTKKMIQRAERIIQANFFFSKSQFRMVFLDHINQIL